MKNPPRKKQHKQIGKQESLLLQKLLRKYRAQYGRWQRVSIEESNPSSASRYEGIATGYYWVSQGLQKLLKSKRQ